MATAGIYQDIARRTEGEVYLGVVGPVRTGKSTFIKTFMDVMVLPDMPDSYKKERLTDELPQSASGRTIMTTQPKFVPGEGAAVMLADNMELKVRLVDCVGYMVEGASGHMEQEQPRMVTTPWSEEPMPFEQAAEIGTRKVITEHSTIGIVVTTDGSFTDIPREGYLQAEKQVVEEMRQQGKPFVVVLNTAAPEGEQAQQLRGQLEQDYGVQVIALNVPFMTREDAAALLESVLMEFPLREVQVELPDWMRALEDDHPLKQRLLTAMAEAAGGMERMKDHTRVAEVFAREEGGTLTSPRVFLGEGRAQYAFVPAQGLFHRVLSETVGADIADDGALVQLLRELIAIRKEHERISAAVRSAWDTGYGIVTPTMEEMKLEEPQMVKQGSRFGVKLKAEAPSLHIMRVDIETEVSPVVGTEKQSEELVKYLLAEFENDPVAIWNTDMFGKSLHDLVREDLAGKLNRMPEDARQKMQRMIARVINEGNGRMICILL